MDTTGRKLTAACLAAADTGADFPTVWQTILKGHPDVAGPPIQRMEGSTALLEIPLVTGERIVVGPGAKDYRRSIGRGDGAAI